MALTEYYVDYDAGTDSGPPAGTSWGAAYKTIQGCLDNATPGAAGSRLNIRAGQPGDATEQVLIQTLDLDDWGLPTSTAPLVLEGCTSTPGDGGVFSVTASGSAYQLFEGSGGVYDTEYVAIKNIIFHDSSAASGIQFDVGCFLLNAELYDLTGATTIYLTTGTALKNVYIHNSSGEVVTGSYLTQLRDCLFASGPDRTFNNYAVDFAAGGVLEDCMFYITGSPHAVDLGGFYNFIYNNSFYTTGTGTAINYTDGNNYRQELVNNLFDGWTNGINFNSQVPLMELYCNNSYYNCSTAEANRTGCVFLLESGNETALSASPFAQRGPMTWANRYNWFEPSNAVRGTAFPYSQ